MHKFLIKFKIQRKILVTTPSELSDKNNRISWKNDKLNQIRIEDVYNQIPENFEAIILSSPIFLIVPKTAST